MPVRRCRCAGRTTYLCPIFAHPPNRRVSPKTYQNPSGTEVSASGVLRWTIDRIRHRLPRPPVAALTPATPDVPYLHGNRSEPSVTWIGHASLLVQIGGCNVLVDPVFSRRVSPVRFAGPRRHQSPGLSVAQLPPIDVVVISHNHFDHLDRPSVRAVARQPGGSPLFLVPRGVDDWMMANVPGVRARNGAEARVRGLEWHDQFSIETADGPLEFHFLPVQHWSSRSALRRNDTPWGSWAMLHPSWRFWYSGDLGYSDDPRRIGERFGHFDLAAIGIGAYEPRWFMHPQHVNPDEAVQVMLDVKADAAIGVHWGTFPLSDEPLDQPPRDLAAALAERGIARSRFTVLQHGETRRESRRETHRDNRREPPNGNPSDARR